MGELQTSDGSFLPPLTFGHVDSNHHCALGWMEASGFHLERQRHTLPASEHRGWWGAGVPLLREGGGGRGGRGGARMNTPVREGETIEGSRQSVSQCYTRPSMDDGAHALAEHRALHTRRCVRSQGKASPQTKVYIVRGAAVGTPTHGPVSACSEMSIAALVLAAHMRALV